MRAAIVQMRQTHPGWGPKTLVAELRIDPRWAEQPLPSRSRIAALLKAEQLTRRYQKPSELPTPAIQLEGIPHDEGDLDAQGRMHVAGVGHVSLLTSIDVVSRLQVESYPCLETTNPPWEAYQLLLRRAFLTGGLPKRITLDPGTVFYENTSASPFPTRLPLWLLALGIDVCFTRKRGPTDHAKMERTPQPMTLQALLGQRWPDHTTLGVGLDGRRVMLNQPIPSSVLPDRAPLQAYPEAAHSGRSSRPEWEAEMLDLDRLFAYLANCRWFRRVRANGRLDLGGYDYSLGTTWRTQRLEVHFELTQGCFLGQLVGSETLLSFAPQGLTKPDLMGELGHLLALPAYQLALPFTFEAWRQLE